MFKGRIMLSRCVSVQVDRHQQIRADVDMSRAEMWTNTMSCEYIHTHTYIYSSGGWWNGEDVHGPGAH